MEITRPQGGSRCHSFLFLLAAVLGLACGRCAAELVIAMINVFYDKNIIDEDALITERWMVGVAFAVAGVMLATMLLEDRHVHQSGRLADRLRAIGDGQIVFKTPQQTHFITLDVERAAELMLLVKRCAHLWDVVSDSHLLKADAITLEKEFDRDLGVIVFRSSAEQGLVQALQARFAQLHSDLRKLDNYLKVQSAIAVPALGGRLCCRRYPILLLGRSVHARATEPGERAGEALLSHGLDAPLLSPV